MSSVNGTGRLVFPCSVALRRVFVGGAPSTGSCRKIASYNREISGPGSAPSSSTSRVRRSVKAASASS